MSTTSTLGVEAEAFSLLLSQEVFKILAMVLLVHLKCKPANSRTILVWQPIKQSGSYPQTHVVNFEKRRVGNP